MADSGEMTGPTAPSLRWSQRWSPPVVLGVAFVAAMALGWAATRPVRPLSHVTSEQRGAGSGADPVDVLERLQTQLTLSSDRDMLQTIVETIVSAVAADGVSLIVHGGETDGLSTTVGSVDRDATITPLVYRGEQLGEVRLSWRRERADDRTAHLLVERLLHEAAAIVYEMRRDAELTAARRDASRVAADVRARVGRDLHDGIAPLLAGAGLAAEALRRGMVAGSADEASAAKLAERLRAAAGEVRRVAHDLRPENLDSLGLDAAIEHYISALGNPGVPDFHLSAAGGVLPPDVEQTAYLVVLEAVNNAVRHARAHHISVRIARVREDNLALMVIDDGVGLAQPYVSGLGITSMRRRVQSLGGTFSIVAGGPYRATGHGTIVTVRLPVDAVAPDSVE